MRSRLCHVQRPRFSSTLLLSSVRACRHCVCIVTPCWASSLSIGVSAALFLSLQSFYHINFLFRSIFLYSYFLVNNTYPLPSNRICRFLISHHHRDIWFFTSFHSIQSFVKYILQGKTWVAALNGERSEEIWPISRSIHIILTEYQLNFSAMNH